MTILAPRPLKVLYRLIEVYVQTGQAVGSKVLTKDFPFSSATLRNIMAELEQQGYLRALHSSSGRLPTSRGLNLYVQNLCQKTPNSLKHENILRKNFSSPNASLTISQTLADLCRCATFCFQSVQIYALRSFDLIYVSGDQALSILLSHEGHVWRRTIHFSHPVAQDLLHQAGAWIEKRISHCLPLTGPFDVKDPLKPVLSEILDQSLCPDEGDLNIKGYEYWLNSVQNIQDLRPLQSLLSWIEPTKRPKNFLNGLLIKKGVHVVFDGKEDGLDLSGSSLIAASYQNQRSRGVVAVMGPWHMNYAAIVPVVQSVARLMATS